MKPVNIAMMSLTHGHTRKYFQTLRDSPRLNWVAVCTDNVAARARFERDVPGIPCYTTAEEMFDRHGDIEAAVLASANSEHWRQMELCAARGVNILSMKIPTFDLAEYDRMIRLVDEAGVVCQIELELYYNPVVRRIRKLVAEGAVGRILSVSATNITLSPVWAFPWQGVPEQSYGRREPLAPRDPRFRGGALCDHPHIFDLLRRLTGSEFRHIFAEVAPNIRTDLEVEDLLLANGKLADGTTLLIDPSWSRLEERLPEPGPGWEVFPKRMEVNLAIVGERGSILADCFGPNVYHNGAPNDRYTVQYTYFDEWIGLIDEFVDCIRNGREPQVNLRWHRPTIEVMNACYESIASGQPVSVGGGQEFPQPRGDAAAAGSKATHANMSKEA
ncbi:MAG: Gfo/Idh/MocA family oxidoreductase [Patescibacteria group bacterium]|nr:Gfo/Idh/MocA family oxidoreductase [Patescibacteria group bacterium]